MILVVADTGPLCYRLDDPLTPLVDATPLGLDKFFDVTQGGSYLATLGFMTQSRWDWRNSETPIVFRPPKP